MKENYWLRLSAAGFLLSSVSVFFLPLVPAVGEQTISAGGRIIGTVFWAGILLGWLCFWICWKKIRGTERYQEIRKLSRPGWRTAFSNRYAKADDFLLAAAVILTVMGNLLLSFPIAVNLFTMFLLLFTFWMHFVLNGRVYRYFIGDV